MLDKVTHSELYGTKNTQITIFDQQHMWMKAKAANPAAMTLKGRAESQNAVLRDGNVPNIVVGGIRHQNRRIVDKKGGVRAARAKAGSPPSDHHASVGRYKSRRLAEGTVKSS